MVGFTLAEVLITLVIIGVIAAITVPSLIAKYHDEQLKTQFKKSYSIISQTINKINLLEFSGQVMCYYGVDYNKNVLSNITTQTKDCREFFNYFPKYLAISKICNGNAKSENCVPTYNKYPDACSKFEQNYVENTNTVFILTSGQIFIFYDDLVNSNTNPLLLIDINGMKGPNKLGYDLFGFTIQKRSLSGGLFLNSHGCTEAKSTGGRTTQNMIKYAFAGQK